MCLLATLATALAIAGDIVRVWTLTPAVTVMSANSTNTTAGTTFEIAVPVDQAHLWVRATGVAATTNGTFVVKFQTAADTNYWNDAVTSNMKLTLSTVGTTTNFMSDWFVFSGVKYIRVGRIENTMAGAVSNIAVRLGTCE